MPGYPFLKETPLKADRIAEDMKTLRLEGVPYTDEQIAAASADVKGKTEMDALIAYLQVMGRALK